MRAHAAAHNDRVADAARASRAGGKGPKPKPDPEEYSDDGEEEPRDDASGEDEPSEEEGYGDEEPSEGGDVRSMAAAAAKHVFALFQRMA